MLPAGAAKVKVTANFVGPSGPQLHPVRWHMEAESGILCAIINGTEYREGL